MTTSYLQMIDATSDQDKLRLVRELMAQDPLGLFKELREHRPILVLPQCTLVANYDDVIELLNMPKVFTVALYQPKMEPTYLMCHDEDALHYREKSLMQSMLNREDLPRIRTMVASIAQAILKRKNSLNAVTDYCRAVPTGLVQQYFGLIGIQPAKLMEWSYWAQVDTFYNQPFDLIPEPERQRIIREHARTGEELGDYITALILGQSIALKLKLPARMLTCIKRAFYRLLGKTMPNQDDIVSRMLRSDFPAEFDFDIKRVGINAGGLLIGTIETTAQASVQALQYILSHPEIHAQAVATAALEDPAKFDAIVWEALRFVPISPYMFRTTASPYTLAKGTAHATTIPANTDVLALTQSAMFDEKAFEQAADFVAGRNWYHYFTFGYGAHECLGKYVGMVMIPEMVRQLILLPKLKADAQIQYDGHMPSVYRIDW